MRWPFSLLFRKDRDTPAAADAGAVGPGAPGGIPDPAPPATVPSRPAAWRSLPPVQRSFGDAPLTAPAVPFGRTLAGRRPPDRILHPLVHDLAADGPAGLVSGIATPLAVHPAPAAVHADHAALPAPRGVQRRARSVTGAPLPTGEVTQSAADAPPAVTLASLPPGTGAPDLPASPSPRVLPVVAPSGAASALAATRVGTSTAPDVAHALAPASAAGTSTAPDVAHALAPASATAASTAPDVAHALAPASATAASTGPGSQVQRSGTSPTAPIATSPGGPPPGARPASGEAPDSARPIPAAAGPTPGLDASVTRPAAPRSLGESRRLGLGAPLASRPSVGRAAAGPDLPLARAGRTSAPSSSPLVAPPAPRRAAAAEAALPVLRVASERGWQATLPEPGAASASDTAGVATPGMGADGGLAGPATPMVQRSGERPLVGDPVRRASTPSGDGADAEPGASEPGEGLQPAVGREIGGAGAASGGTPAGEPSAGRGPLVASTPAQDAFGQRPSGPLSADHGGAAPPVHPTLAPGAPPARSVPLVVARALRGSAPLGPTAGGAAAVSPATPGRVGAPAGAGAAPDPAGAAPALPVGQAPAEPSPAGAGSGWPVAQRSPFDDGGWGPDSRAPVRRVSMPVARPAALPGPSTLAAGLASEPIAISRLADGGGSAPSPPGRVMGWSAGVGFAAMPAPGASAVQRSVVIDEVATQVDAAPAPGAAGGGTVEAAAGGAGQDYEEIADRVYDRIRSRFATELLLDRERMGLLIDG